MVVVKCDVKGQNNGASKPLLFIYFFLLGSWGALWHSAYLTHGLKDAHRTQIEYRCSPTYECSSYELSIYEQTLFVNPNSELSFLKFKYCAIDVNSFVVSTCKHNAIVTLCVVFGIVWGFSWIRTESPKCLRSSLILGKTQQAWAWTVNLCWRASSLVSSCRAIAFASFILQIMVKCAVVTVLLQFTWRSSFKD